MVARRGRPAPFPLHHSTSKQPKPASARYAITIERCGAGSHACYQHCVTHSKISPTFSRSASVHTPFSFLYTTCARLRQRVSAKKYCGVRSFSTNGNEHDLKKKKKKHLCTYSRFSMAVMCGKKYLIHILDGTRTRNLRLRRPTSLSIRPRGRRSRYHCLIAHTRADRPFAVHSFSSSLSQGLDTVAHECLHAQKTYYKYAPREIDLIQENNTGLMAQIGRARVCSRWLRSTFQN